MQRIILVKEQKSNEKKRVSCDYAFNAKRERRQSFHFGRVECEFLCSKQVYLLINKSVGILAFFCKLFIANIHIFFISSFDAHGNIKSKNLQPFSYHFFSSSLSVCNRGSHVHLMLFCKAQAVQQRISNFSVFFVMLLLSLPSSSAAKAAVF